TAKEGGVCQVINQSCCAYINQDKRIEMDLSQIWQRIRVVHQVTKDDTSWGFSDLWEKLTPWLPNFTWLKQLFMALIVLIVLGLLVCRMLQCFMWRCKQIGNSYEKWKQHKLRQNIESGKYLAKT
ncbi:ERVV1 protein, partial [Atlantisia rogersi]|nr:ERVV1 protein [Atlantisia rogersi]